MKHLEYLGYFGSAEVSVDDGVLHGKLLYIKDLVTFEADTTNELISAFHEAVDAYLEDCKEEGRKPDTPFKGAFNLRVPPIVHRKLAEAASIKNMSLNEYVSDVLLRHVSSEAKFRPNQEKSWGMLKLLSYGSGSHTFERMASSEAEPVSYIMVKPISKLNKARTVQ
jgi:predicted HicB family RNase H-like nuclease